MVRRLARIARVVCGVVALAAMTSSLPATPRSVDTGPQVARGYYPEVRLRKLHLVRPDLIPYPIEYDVYC